MLKKHFQMLSPAIFCLLVGCAAIPAAPDADQVSGWFRSTGEWTLFTEEDGLGYTGDDLTAPPECINLVNATGYGRERFSSYDGRRVKVRGELVDYESLPIGEDPHSVILSRRTWRGFPVQNSCLSEHVLIATHIIPE